MKAILFLVFCFSGIIASAQIEEIDAAIADYEAQIAEAASEEMEELVPHISTTCPLMLAAIGPVNHNIDIYFDHIRIEGVTEEVTTIHDGAIRKVSFQITSGSYDFIYTYHFDKIGKLIFYSERAEDANYGCTLSSYYFKDDKCIQLKSELLATEFCELPTENQPEIRTELSDIEMHTVNTALDNTKKFKNLLSLYVDLMFN
jgi:hypothetical protein